MYRTFTSSSGTCRHLLFGGGPFDCVDEEADASAKLGRGALERGERLLVASGLARWVGDAPMDQLGSAGELGADLAYAIAEADYVIEALLRELAQVFGPAAGKVDVALAHHPHRVGMQRLRMAARACRSHSDAGQLLAERLGDLGARAVAGAQEQHPRQRSAGLARVARPRDHRQPRVQRHAGAPQQLAAALQIENVVAVTAVGRAATHRDKTAVT